MTTFANVDVDTFVDSMVDSTKAYVDQCMAVLEARLAAIEAAPAMKYVGIWNVTKAYAAGSVATHDGSAWVAIQDVAGARPGTSSAWQLAVKRGKDAR